MPITVTSALPGTREIMLLVDGNPQPVAVRFTIPAGTEPFVATRIRMAGSGTVYAAVHTDDGLYAAARAIEVNGRRLRLRARWRSRSASAAGWRRRSPTCRS